MVNTDDHDLHIRCDRWLHVHVSHQYLQPCCLDYTLVAGCVMLKVQAIGLAIYTQSWCVFRVDECHQDAHTMRGNCIRFHIMKFICAKLTGFVYLQYSYTSAYDINRWHSWLRHSRSQDPCRW